MAGLMQGAAQPAQQNTGTAALDDPALEQAISNIGKRLYNEDLAQKIADTVGKSETNVPRNLATIAYKLAESSDADTDNDIKEENLSVLGMIALNEVFEIAEAAGVSIQASDVSVAFKHMVVMFAEDQGLPEDQVQALANAMSEVNDRELADAAETVPESTFNDLPDEDVPVPGEQRAPQAAMGV